MSHVLRETAMSAMPSTDFFGIPIVNGAPDFLGAAGDFLGGIFGIPPSSTTTGQIAGPFEAGVITPDLANATFANFGLDPNGLFGQMIFTLIGTGQLAIGPDEFIQLVADVAHNQQQSQTLTDLMDEVGRGRRAQMESINEEERRLNASANRLRTVLEPGGLESDAEFAGLLQQAERPLAGIVRDTRNSAAQGLANAGLRSAGKATSGVRRAEIGVQGERGRIRSGVLGGVQGQLRNIQNTLDIGIPEARRQVEAGVFPNLLQSSAFGQGINVPDFFSGTGGTAEDRAAGRAGLDLSRFGLDTELFLGTGNLAHQGTQDFLNILFPNRG